MKLCIPTLSNYDGVDRLIRSAEAGSQKPSGYVILDNGGGYLYGRAACILGPQRTERLELNTSTTNLGVAASWNWFLEHHGHEPIVISNDDIVLGEHAFRDLVELSEDHPHVGYGWALFMQRPDCTARVGYYDENFWPAYYEDIDYIIRMKKAGVPEHRLEGEIDIQHPGWTTMQQLGDPPWLADGREKNRSYLIAKWGADQYGTPYAEPFNGRPPPGWAPRKRLPALPLRWDLVNAIARRIGAKRYLELGLADGSCIRRIEVAARVGVDVAQPPSAPGAEIHTQTTDEFFRTYTGEKFDLVFVDADHAWEQAYRDVQNAIRHLDPGGVVVMHDCSPFSEEMQIVPHTGYHLWTGDVWKAVVKLRWEGQHAVRVVDSNYGLGIVIPGGVAHHLECRPRKPEAVTYQDLVERREDLLGLLSGWEWEEWFEAAYLPIARDRGRARLMENLHDQAARALEKQTCRDADARARQPFLRFTKGGPEKLELTKAREMLTLSAVPVVKAFEREVSGIGGLGRSVEPKPAPEQDTLIVIFTTLPRPDTTGTHLLKAFCNLGVKTRYHEPLRKVDGLGLCEGLGGMDISDARAILCIDDDHGWRVPITSVPHVPTYYWCIDTYRMDAELYLGGTRRNRTLEFDKVFYVQKKEAEAFGGVWLPVGVDLSLYRHEPAEKLYDFCFIGNRNVARDAFIDRLKAEFPRSFVGTAYGEEANKIYNQSHIAVNYSAGGDINMRMFEAQATSALCLSNRIDNGERELLPYLSLYESYEECVTMMRVYLKHPGACKTLAQAQADSMLVHTYEARARAFLAAIGWEV